MRVIAAVAVLAFAISSSAAEPKDDPQAVVDKAIAALGGADKLAKAKAHSWKAKGSMTAMGMEMKYNADYLFAPADKFRFDLFMELGGMKVTMAVASNGKEMWESMGEMLQDMPKEKKTEFAHNVYVMYLSQVTPLKDDKALKLTSLGESKVGDQTVIGIKVSQKDKRDVSLFFDTKNYLLVKTSTQMKDEFTGGKEVTQETLLSGYRDRDGVKVFDKITIRREGKDFIVEEMSDQKALESVDEKKFEKPKK